MKENQGGGERHKELQGPRNSKGKISGYVIDEEKYLEVLLIPLRLRQMLHSTPAKRQGQLGNFSPHSSFEVIT
jgi:hypothetical protein